MTQRYFLRAALSKPEAAKYVGVGRSTIYEMMREKSLLFDPSFPAPVNLTTGRVGLLIKDLDAWLEDPARKAPKKLQK